MIKKIVKKILKSFGWSLVKISRRVPKEYVNQEPNIEEIKIIMKSKGVLHLGAHRGKEGLIYNWFNKRVLWIEAIPEIYEDLENHIKFFYNQKSIKALLGKENKKNVDFYISNRDSSSSSIFDLSKDVKKGKLWKKQKVKMLKKTKLNMQTLDDVVYKNGINIKNYDHWVIDLQGSELQALMGSKKSIKFCKSISVEISKNDFYEKGSTKWENLKKFLILKGFLLKLKPIADHCDVLFIRK